MGLAWTWLNNRFVHGRKVNTVLCVILVWKAFVAHLRSPLVVVFDDHTQDANTRQERILPGASRPREGRAPDLQDTRPLAVIITL